jgi:predicted permease
MPDWTREIRRRLASLDLPADRERSIVDELSQHLEDHYRDLVSGGATDADARRAVLAGLDRHELLRQPWPSAPATIETQEADSRMTRLVTNLLQDLRYAARMLRRHKGLTVVAVLTLALGIGANTAVFTTVDAVLLRPLPYRNSEQLVKIWGRYDKEGIPQNWISEPEWWDMRAALRSFTSMAAYSTGGGANFTRQGGDPLRVTMTFASADLWPLLGAQPLLGRVFTAEEDQPGARNVVLLDYGFWNSQMAGDPSVVGQSIQLNGEPYTVVGVLPNGFAFGGDANMWVPLALDPAKPANRGSHYLEVIARLQPNVTPAQAGAELDTFARHMAEQFPQNYRADTGFGMFVRPLRDELVANVRLLVVVVFAAVTFVLLIACINLANLLLARSSARGREIAVRAALGAGRGRLIMQLVTESVLLAALGGVCGVLLAVWATDAFGAFAANVLPSGTHMTIDARVLAYAAGLSLLTGVLFGLAPAWQLSRPQTAEALKDAARDSSAHGGRSLRAGLVIAEIAIALVLVVAAGLMIRTLQRLLDVSPGFRAEHLLTARISLPATSYKDAASATAFYRRVMENVQTMPGVQAAGMTSLLPMTGRNSSGSTFIEQTSRAGLPVFDPFRAPYIETDQRSVVPGFFETMHIPLVSGRLLTAADNATAPPVAVVDEEFARRIRSDRNPIGQHIATNAVPNSNPPVPLWVTVVGVVGHVKNNALDQQGREQTYFPVEQQPFRVSNMYLVARATGEPAALATALQRQVRALDPSLPVYEVKAMDEWLHSTVSDRRVTMVLLAAFGALALLLAAIGTYGVIAYSVNQRTKEIGIRVALGATRGDVRRMILSAGLRLAAIGVAIGVLLAAIATRLLSGLLFDVPRLDPATFAVTIAVLLGAALAASYGPARRATRVDPMNALRYE